MHSPISNTDQAHWSYISTGHLPEPEMVQNLVSDAYARLKPNTDGEISQVYPALARVPSDLFGVCIVGTSGRIYAAGDVEYDFTIMSVSKPFVFALVCEAIGPNRRATSSSERHRAGVQFAGGHREGAGRANQSDGECRRDCNDEPCPGGDG